MKSFDAIQSGLEKVLGPIAQKLGNSNILTAISTGMMQTLPLTLGAAAFLVLASFPVPAVSEFFAETGITPHLNAIAGGTISVIALFVSFTVAQSYANNMGANGTAAGVFSLSGFLILMPQTVGEGDNIVSAFAASNLGSNGLFVAMFIAISSAVAYVKLSKNEKLVFSLPDSVPPMVSQSMAPIFIGMIIYVGFFLLHFLFALTPYGNIFNFVSNVIATPLMSIGGSVPALILVYMFCNLLFFFGIHPSPVQAIVVPIIYAMQLSAVDSIAAGQSIQYLDNLVVFDFINNDATGSTLSLLIAFLLVARSKRYRAFSKVSIVPNAFNINEPVIFGMPVVFNAYLFIPFVLSSAVSGLMGLLAVKIGFLATYNASVALALPWTLPKVISSFFVYGWQGSVWRLVTMAVLTCLYIPFVKMLDNHELAEEGELEDGSEIEGA